MTPWEALEAAKEGGKLAREQFSGDDDKAKANRSILAYEAFCELCNHYSRANSLLILDPNKNGGPKQPTLYGVSERHVRRVETIRLRRPKQRFRLEEIAKSGAVSLETIEHLVLHPSTDLVEVVWLVLDDAGKT